MDTYLVTWKEADRVVIQEAVGPDRRMGTKENKFRK
jgi:hypothetical protein